MCELLDVTSFAVIALGTWVQRRASGATFSIMLGSRILNALCLVLNSSRFRTAFW